MKKLILPIVLLTSASIAFGANKKGKEKEEGYVFTPVKELKITSVKNQNRSGTCWSYSGISFIESEILRMSNREFDLSEMFVVNHSYKDKADKYVRLHGKLNFGQGGSFEDVLYVLEHYGIVPNEVMTGLEYGESLPVHDELDALAGSFLKTIVTNPNKKLSPVWRKGYDGIIDAYLGKLPEKFTHDGKEYTPKEFAKEIGFDKNNYVSLTSFTHHPFYKTFPIEVEDNWRWADSYNLPIDELMQVFENAINTGYSIAWGSDVSEIGFNRNGIAVVPDIKAIENSGSDQDRWLGLSKAERNSEIRRLIEKPCAEIEVTQEMRQKAYDNYETTDDHGMHIYGIAKDQTGKKFYMVKNSWGTDNKYKGTWYASETFVKYKTMNIIVHKDAIPQAIREKLGI